MIRLIFLFYFTFTSISYAYLDPGTGSIILQVIIGFVAALFSKVKFFFNKIKNFFLKKKSK